MKTSEYIKIILLIILIVYGIAAFCYSFFAFLSGAMGAWLLAAGLTLGLLVLVDLIALIAVKRFGSKVSLYDVHMKAGTAISVIAGVFCILTGFAVGNWALLLMIYVFFTILPAVPASMALAFFLYGGKPQSSYIHTKKTEEGKE